PFASILSVPGMAERSVIVDGFSKTYAMTGWRLGYSVSRPDFAAHLARIETNLHSCTATFSQIAAIDALEGSQAEAQHMTESFRWRAQLVTRLLNEIDGFRCAESQGAF